MRQLVVAERENSGRFKPGASGNPLGKPIGSRNRLGEAFIADLQASWQEHGAEVIQRVIKQRPGDYLRVIASLLPRELRIDNNSLNNVSDAELGQLLEQVRELARSAKAKLIEGSVEKANDINEPINCQSKSHPSGLSATSATPGGEGEQRGRDSGNGGGPISPNCSRYEQD